jgi:hypothetical protein
MQAKGEMKRGKRRRADASKRFKQHGQAREASKRGKQDEQATEASKGKQKQRIGASGGKRRK